MTKRDEQRRVEKYLIDALERGGEDILDTLRVGMPDLEVGVDEVIVEGEQVVALWYSVGRHTRAIWGVPATGKTVTIRHFTRFEIRGETIARVDTLTDRLSVLTQLRSVGDFAPCFTLAPRASDGTEA